MDTRKIGRTLEQKIVNKFQEIGVKASLSKNSGCAGYNLGDINQSIAVVECKLKNTDSIQVNEEVWQKLVNSIPLHSSRIPMYCLMNKNKKTWVVTDVDTFFQILKGYLANLNGRI